MTTCSKCGGYLGSGSGIINKDQKPCSCIPPMPFLNGTWQTFPTTAKAPHRCPVCGGTMLVPAGFYASVTGVTDGSSTAKKPCRACVNGVIIC